MVKGKKICLAVLFILLLGLSTCAYANSGCPDNRGGAHRVTNWSQSTTQHSGVCGMCHQTVTESHIFTEQIIRQPTCTTAGMKNKTCTVCGYQTSIVLSKTAHDYAAATCTKPKTCRNCGATSGSANGHKAGSTFGKDAENHWEICSICGAKLAIALHIWDNGTVTKDATYTETGVKTYSCTLCGQTKKETIPIKSHTHSYTVDQGEVTAATCTKAAVHKYKCAYCSETTTKSYGSAAGHKAGSTFGKDAENHWEICSVCGAKLAIALHIWDNGTVTKAATYTETGVKTYSCTLCGQTKKETIPIKSHTHSYTIDQGEVISATCTTAAVHKYKCAYCSETTNKSYGGAAGHKAGSTFGKDAQNHWQICSKCGAKLNTAAHVWDNGKVTKAATTTSTGIKTYTCSICGQTKTETIAKLAHTTHSYTVDLGEVTAATCTKVATHKYRCSECTATTTKSYGSALGHNYSSTYKKDSTNHWQECTRCGVKRNEANHKWDAGKVTKAATTSSTGTLTYTCTVCGQTKTETIPKVQASHTTHSYTIDLGEVTPATCTTPAIHQYRCSGCSLTITKEYGAAAGHKFSEIYQKDANNHWQQCTVCGLKQNIAPHTWNNGKITKSPTTTSTGTKTYTCTICGQTKTDEIAKLPSNAENDPIPSTPNPLEIDISAQYKSKTLQEIAKTEAYQGDEITLNATPIKNALRINYFWDKSEPINTISGSSGKITIPKEFKDGSTHKLYAVATATDGNTSRTRIYTFVIPDGSDPEHTPLEVLPWEEENFEIEDVSILLRNDSESTKANKNMYALKENVTYFIDFKNGGDAINKAVNITLKLPLGFDVVQNGGGTVNKTARTITWTYKNGMVKNYSGTKKVVIKYTALSNTKMQAETIYPLARILVENNIKDSSAVINYIYIDSETKINVAHAPYMYGDAYATTFRPDDTITRDEGALVLARILLGQDVIDNTEVINVYPDIGETYLEAQRAISACTNYGIINGYIDGTYKPKRTMTRAEFMKILAKFLEINSQNQNIEGLEIKDINKSVKLYNNPVSEYIVNGQIITTHWAIEEISLLYRLNMTSISKDETDLRIDKGITRAEVAQLVNFYLLRAPAMLDDNTYIRFSDVSRSHILISDIIEATRPSHLYRITSDGKEIAE